MVADLSDFIAANNALIVDECEAFARTLGPAAQDMDRDALRDHIDQILVTIAADMKVPQTEREWSEKSKGHAPVTAGGPDPAAETHGTLRAASGFDINQTAAECRALRASVIRLWLETSPTLGPRQGEDLTRCGRAGLLHRLFRLGQFDLFDAIGGEDGDGLVLKRTAHGTSCESGRGNAPQPAGCITAAWARRDHAAGQDHTPNGGSAVGDPTTLRVE
ncbi:MAG: RsbRD N-terminal domain-containing protein [Proteobacteria bacterium]|nr:RsbRD N-terminal domain-containing protein [Pseudomonadota bacterium]